MNSMHEGPETPFTDAGKAVTRVLGTAPSTIERRTLARLDRAHQRRPASDLDRVLHFAEAVEYARKVLGAGRHILIEGHAVTNPARIAKHIRRNHRNSVARFVSAAAVRHAQSGGSG